MTTGGNEQSSHWTSDAISAAYATFRPGYSDELFAAVLKHVSAKRVYVDIGCGSGQAIRGLAPSFQRAYGVDISESQIAHAPQIANVTYRIGSNVSCTEEASVDLVTVAQALHWFDVSRLMLDIEKHLAPGGVFATWFYGTCRLEPSGCDAILQELDTMLLDGKYWPPERWDIEDSYARVRKLIPFRELHSGDYPTRTRMSIDDFVRYLSTWSGIKEYEKRTGDVAILETIGARLSREATHIDAEFPVRLLVFGR